MSEALDGKLGNGTAVGMSTVAAGVVGTLVSSLFSGKEARKERAREQVEQRLQILEAQTALAMEQLARVAEGLNAQEPGESRRAQRRARDLGKAASRLAERTATATKRQIAELDREAIRLQSLERANQLGHDGSRRARELARLLNDRRALLVAQNRNQLPEWRMRTSRSASEAIGKGSTLVQKAVESAPNVRDRVAAHQAPAVLDKVTKSLGDVAQQSAKVVGHVREGTPGTLDKVSKTAHDALEQTRGKAPEVRSRALDLATEASERAQLLAQQAKAHAPEVGQQVATALHAAQEGVKPVVEDVTARAARLVEEAKGAGSRAGETIIPDVQHRVEAVAGKAKSQGAVTAATLTAIGSTAGSKLAQKSDALEQQSKAVATAAGRGTKDGTALVLWTMAAGGIVYYVLLDDEQRAKVKESGHRIFAEIKEVYRDIRGYDEEFT